MGPHGEREKKSLTPMGFELTTSGFELVGFCFSQTECFSLQILSQTINTVSALDKPALNTL